LITLLIVLDTSLRFDRIAGRMAGGALASSVDAWLHGTATRPVFLPSNQATSETTRAQPAAADVVGTPAAAGAVVADLPATSGVDA
jgi:hypothetical protein